MKDKEKSSGAGEAEQQVLFGRDSYDAQIAQISVKLIRGTEVRLDHLPGQDPTPREVSLTEPEKDRLTWERDVLEFKKRHPWFSPSDIVHVAQRDYIANPLPGAFERVERLQREQTRRTIRSARTGNAA